MQGNNCTIYFFKLPPLTLIKDKCINAHPSVGSAVTQDNLQGKMKVNNFDQKKSPEEFYLNWKNLDDTGIIPLGLI